MNLRQSPSIYSIFTMWSLVHEDISPMFHLIPVKHCGMIFFCGIIFVICVLQMPKPGLKDIK